MKNTLIILLASLSWSCADDLEKLQGIRNEMLARAAQPIQDNYRREVQRLLDVALKAKDLASANKCRDALTAIDLIGTWHPKTNNGFHFCFGVEGTVWQTVGGNQVGRWRVKEGKILFNQNGQLFEIDAETKKGKITNDGKVFPVELVRSSS